MEAASSFVDPVLPRISVLVARGTFYLIALLLTVTLIWLWVTRVNVVVRADGRLTPRAEPLRLSIAQGGIVSKVMVTVGSKVEPGQPILEIDAFRQAADTATDRHELEQAKAELQRYSENAQRFEAATGHIREALASEAEVMKLVSSQAGELREGYDGGAVSLFEVQVKERDLAEAQARIAQLNSDLSRSAADAQQNRWLEAQTAQKIKSLQIKLSRDMEVKL
jgi:multidrug efflux pump subunit AcrA (membrane-fusion protein)